MTLLGLLVGTRHRTPERARAHDGPLPLDGPVPLEGVRHLEDGLGAVADAQAERGQDVGQGGRRPERDQGGGAHAVPSPGPPPGAGTTPGITIGTGS